MAWNLDFISRDDFKQHVVECLLHKYAREEKTLDVTMAEELDPIKLLFDQGVYGLSWAEAVSRAVAYERDRREDDFNYFHKYIFAYIPHCTVLETGWDVMVELPDETEIAPETTVRRLYAVIKGDDDTLDDASAEALYRQMAAQVEKEGEAACLLVEVAPHMSQNVPWTVDGEVEANPRVRRVSIDRFYALVTGDRESYPKVVQALPEILEEVLRK